MQPHVRAIVDRLYPPGSTVRNTGTLTWDSPDRQQPYFDQVTAGYEREIFSGVSFSADYVHMNGTDLFFNPDLNIGNRVTTESHVTRDSRHRSVRRPDADVAAG